MSQRDLFAPPEVRLCGTCVHWNRGADTAAGSCTPVGDRPHDGAPYGSWFGLEQFRLSLYGARAPLTDQAAAAGAAR